MSVSLEVAIKEFKAGAKEVTFLLPYIGCSKDHIANMIKEQTGKSVDIENGYFAFTLVGTVCDDLKVFGGEDAKEKA
jgi:hypothetical protein